MSNNIVNEFLEYRKNVKKVTSTIGVWPVENPTVTYRLLPFIPGILNFIMMFNIYGFIRDHSENIGMMTKGAGVLISFLTTTIKISFITLYQKELLVIHKALDREFLELPNQSEFLQYVLEKVNIFKRLTYLGIFLALFTTIFWITVPLITNLYRYYNPTDPVHYSLIFPTSYPWTQPKSGLSLKLHFIYESISAVSLFFISISVDSVFPYYVFLIITQLRESSYNITHVKSNADCKLSIKKYTVKYCLLTECRDILQKIYGPLVLWISGANALVLCSLVFQVSQMETISTGTMFIIAMYISIKLTQAYVYGWSGANLIAESEQCRTAIYNADWYGNKYFMTSLAISLPQRPLVLTACHLSEISLNLFVMIVKTSISYFFLLQTLEEK